MTAQRWIKWYTQMLFKEFGIFSFWEIQMKTRLILQQTESITDQEMRLENWQNGAPRGSTQTVCFIHTDAKGPQGF